RHTRFSRDWSSDVCSSDLGGVAVLKGAGTVVAREGVLPAFCDRGNPGMATGGMGDVLTGVIAGIVAQGADLHTAACAGVLVHARSEERRVGKESRFPVERV